MRLPSRRAHALLIVATLGAGALAAASDHGEPTEQVAVSAPAGDDTADPTTGRPAPRPRPTATDDPSTTSTTSGSGALPGAEDGDERTSTTGRASSPVGDAPVTPGTGPAGGGPPERPGRTDDGGMFDAFDWTPGPVLTGGPAPCIATDAAPMASGLLVVDLAAGCLRSLLQSNHQPNGAPSWSPDGTWLLTIDDYARPVRIAADGTWYQVLANGYFHQAALSPDGNRIAALAMQPDGTGQLVVVGVDGAGARLVRSFSWPALDGIRWSPDGRYVVVNSQGGMPGSGGVTVVAADGSGSWQLPDAGAYPVWSPEGVLAMVMATAPSMGIAFSGNDVSQASVAFTSPAMSHEWIEWLDGRRLLYIGRDEGEDIASTTFVLDIATGQTEIALDDATLSSVAPDGRTLAFATRDEQTTVPLGVAVGTIGGPRRTVWTPGGRRASNWLLAPPAWSPDGTRLALVVYGAF